jgi:hypothetical protein
MAVDGNPNLIARRRSAARPADFVPSASRIAARPDVLPVQVPHLDRVRIPEGIKIPIRAADAANAMAKHTPLDDLMDGLARYAMDPLGFVMWAFPWGEPGTSLADMDGPEEWQRKQLDRVGHRLREGGDEGAVVEEDVSAGHGVGKSALVSWMILWGVSTHADTRGVVTANTDMQLRTKTWAELTKWYSLFIARQLFTLTATAIYIADDPVREKAWRIDQVPWSKDNTEAFAGLHNQGKRVMVVFDEASAIHDNVWEVTEGAMTDAKTQIIWLRYGNPTKTTGQFFKRCTQPKRNTYTRVDSRTVRFTNKKQIQAWIDDYGDDSDFVRVRVKGEFPRAGYSNFIAPSAVTEARARGRNRAIHLNEYGIYPKIISVDPARFGDDSTVITLRQGRKVHFQLELKGFDGFDIASRLEQIVKDEGRPSCIAYDAIGNGAELDGVLKRAPWARGIPLIPVQWGVPAKDDKQYFNQRSECWGHMRDWLAHGAIPDDDELAEQLSSLDYGYDVKMRIQLQSKKDAKKEGKPSPDKADSLAISFVPELIDLKVRVAKVIPQKRRLVVMTRT